MDWGELSHLLLTTRGWVGLCVVLHSFRRGIWSLRYRNLPSFEFIWLLLKLRETVYKVLLFSNYCNNINRLVIWILPLKRNEKMFLDCTQNNLYCVYTLWLISLKLISIKFPLLLTKIKNKNYTINNWNRDDLISHEAAWIWKGM